MECTKRKIGRRNAFQQERIGDTLLCYCQSVLFLAHTLFLVHKMLVGQCEPRKRKRYFWCGIVSFSSPLEAKTAVTAEAVRMKSLKTIAFAHFCATKWLLHGENAHSVFQDCSKTRCYALFCAADSSKTVCDGLFWFV